MAEAKKYTAVGRRKRSIARVTLTEGTGKITINGEDVKFMQIMRADKITPHCNYRPNKALNSRMNKEVFEKSVEFCRKIF